MKARIVLFDGTIVEAEGPPDEIADLTDALRRSHQLAPSNAIDGSIAARYDAAPAESEAGEGPSPDGAAFDGAAFDGAAFENAAPEDLAGPGPPDAEPASGEGNRKAGEGPEQKSSVNGDDRPGPTGRDLETDINAEAQAVSERPRPAPPLDLVVREIAGQFQLLSDATRLQILGLLQDGGRNVSELCEVLGGQSQPAVSHHLALLRVSGLAAPSREGKYNYYALTDQGRALTEAVGRLGAPDAPTKAEAFRLVADPTRLQVLIILSDEERNVGELCSDLGIQSQPAVSHHLAKLRHGGLIEPRRLGKFNYYALREEGRELARLIAPMMAARARGPADAEAFRFDAEPIDFSDVSDDWMRGASNVDEDDDEDEATVGPRARDAAPPTHGLCRRALLMVRDLHRRGYEWLRVAPGLSPLRLEWRCAIVSIHRIRRDHGAMVADEAETGVVARYTSSQGASFFGWDDVELDPPAVLANKFLARFPDLAAEGRGPDPDYARWYAQMLEETGPDGLIYAYADWELPEDHLPALGCTVDVKVSMPPPGEAPLGI